MVDFGIYVLVTFIFLGCGGEGFGDIDVKKHFRVRINLCCAPGWLEFHFVILDLFVPFLVV